MFNVSHACNTGGTMSIGDHVHFLKSCQLERHNRIKTMVWSCITNYILKSIFFFQNNYVKVYPLKVRDNEDVEHMFVSHEHSSFNYIELYTLLQQTIPSQ